MPEEAEELGEGSEAETMTFWDHAEELAKRLKVVIYSLFVSTILMMILPADLKFLNSPIEFYQPLIALVLRKIREDALPPNVKLIGMELTGPIELYMVASFIFGIALTIPIAAYEIYKFVEPALYPQEKKDIYPFLASFSALFITGLGFGYKILTPYLIWALLPFFSAVGAEMVVSLMDFYTLLLITTLAIGLFFTFPVFFVILVKHGIMSTEIVTKNRRYVYAGLFILVCFITPDGGHVGNIMLFAPIIALVEVGVLLARRYEKKEMMREPRWFREAPKCRFCGESLRHSSIFCPKCGKSQK